jgi:hypothetical protein
MKNIIENQALNFIVNLSNLIDYELSKEEQEMVEQLFISSFKGTQNKIESYKKGTIRGPEEMYRLSDCTINPTGEVHNNRKKYTYLVGNRILIDNEKQDYKEFVDCNTKRIVEFNIGDKFYYIKQETYSEEPTSDIIKNVEGNYINYCECDSCKARIGTDRDHYRFDNAIYISEIYLNFDYFKDVCFNILKSKLERIK